MGAIKGSDIASGVLFLIFVYLLIKNGQNTNSVIQALSQGFDGAVGTLQGNNTTGFTSPATSTGFA